jgi:hypothetical protein
MGATLTIHLSGTSQSDCQDHLRRMLPGAKNTFKSRENTLRLVAETENQYDEHAIRVDALYDGSTEWAKIGYVPRRWCLNCFKTLSGKNADLAVCCFCKRPTPPDRQSYPNQVVKEALSNQKLAWCEIEWIGSALANGTLGVILTVRIE